MAHKTKTAKAAKASRENGKLGGRPKGFAALEAEAQRAWAAEDLRDHFKEIWAKAIEQAKSGDKGARDYVTEFPFGKAIQPTSFSDPNGDPLFKPSLEDKAKAEQALNDLFSGFMKKI